MTKSYIKLEKDLKEALESHKNVLIAHEQGAGKTLTSVKVVLEINKNDGRGRPPGIKIYPKKAQSPT